MKRFDLFISLEHLYIKFSNFLLQINHTTFGSKIKEPGASYRMQMRLRSRTMPFLFPASSHKKTPIAMMRAHIKRSFHSSSIMTDIFSRTKAVATAVINAAMPLIEKTIARTLTGR